MIGTSKVGLNSFMTKLHTSTVSINGFDPTFEVQNIGNETFQNTSLGNASFPNRSKGKN